MPTLPPPRPFLLQVLLVGLLLAKKRMRRYGHDTKIHTHCTLSLSVALLLELRREKRYVDG